MVLMVQMDQRVKAKKIHAQKMEIKPMKQPVGVYVCAALCFSLLLDTCSTAQMRRKQMSEQSGASARVNASVIEINCKGQEASLCVIRPLCLYHVL